MKALCPCVLYIYCIYERSDQPPLANVVALWMSLIYRPGVWQHNKKMNTSNLVAKQHIYVKAALSAAIFNHVKQFLQLLQKSNKFLFMLPFIIPELIIISPF